MLLSAQFQRKWFYDPTRLPIAWTTHPHEVFKLGTRVLLALLGSIVPVGLVMLHSGVMANLDQGAMQVGWVFWTVIVVFCVVWIIAVLAAASSEEKAHLKYIYLGSVAPANLTVVYLLVQNVK